MAELDARFRIDELEPDTSFRDTISVPVRASGGVVLAAAREVTLNDMPLAQWLGKLRYLPGRLLGRKAPPDEARQPFFDLLVHQGTVVLSETPEREIVTGSAGKYHQLRDQEPVPLRTAEEFFAFNQPGYQKLVMSLRVEPDERPDMVRLVLEHRTHPLDEAARRGFARYWRVIRPSGAFVSKQLLQAIRRRAEEKHASGV